MPKLQCGHGQEAVENGDTAADLSFRQMASMRPRPGGRGELPFAKVCKIQRSGLQCGHGQEAVENVPDHPSNLLLTSASMRPRPGGRGELRHEDCFSSIPLRFNAATARRPWRTMSIVYDCGMA